VYDAVCLSSGGLDSLLCLHLLRERGMSALPAFVNYGQINCSKELGSLLAACDRYKFPEPVIFDVSGFGAIVRTGLTDRLLRVNEDAFTPNRNMLFLLLASSLAYSRGIRNIVLGLLAERTTIFPDQTDRFLQSVEAAITESLGVQIFIHSPLRSFTKQNVVSLAEERGITSYYSCHLGTDEPCGKCIACLEYK
jgi:7-cyano-7-deazaguanine synthase